MSQQKNERDEREALKLLENGSRDRVRKLLGEAAGILIEAATENGKLRHAHRKDVSYRYDDAYIGAALAQVELARIVMRKRRRNEAPRVEVPDAKGVSAPPAPIEEEEQ